MKAVVQRVSSAQVTVNNEVVGAIRRGLLVYVGIGKNDTEQLLAQLARKLVQLRVFPDTDGKMGRSLLDVGGELLIVSQFTLYGDTRKGNRPSYSDAAPPANARALYESFVSQSRALGVSVQSGVFQAQMEVVSVNDGPVTLLFHSEP